MKTGSTRTLRLMDRRQKSTRLRRPASKEATHKSPVFGAPDLPACSCFWTLNGKKEEAPVRWGTGAMKGLSGRLSADVLLQPALRQGRLLHSWSLSVLTGWHCSGHHAHARSQRSRTRQQRFQAGSVRPEPVGKLPCIPSAHRFSTRQEIHPCSP